MKKIAHSFFYKSFGLTVKSDISLPELTPYIMEGKLADIVIKRIDSSDSCFLHQNSDKKIQIKENLIAFQLSEKAKFLIRNGKEILYSSINDSNEDFLRLYILGTCMGVILMQRKILPLHGSCVVINDYAYAIVGHSGAGKSTLASAFLQRGYQLLSDDVIPVIFSDEHIPMVIPSYPQQKLWMESLEQFGMESSNYQPIVERETKFSVPVTTQFVNQPMPLGGIIELIKTEEDDIQMNPIIGMERFHTLFTHTYRNIFLEKSGLMDWHFKISAKLIEKVPINQISRPILRFTSDEIVKLILASNNEKVTATE